jgi:hypothetical protein
MCHQALFHCRFDALYAANVSADFSGTLIETSLEFVQHCWVCCHSNSQLLALYCLQMFDCHLENIGLLQLGMACWLQQFTENCYLHGKLAEFCCRNNEVTKHTFSLSSFTYSFCILMLREWAL